MIYDGNVRIANFSQLEDLIPQWVIEKCTGSSYHCENYHRKLFELLFDAVYQEANQLVRLVCIVWNIHLVIKSSLSLLNCYAVASDD